ncbi:hypothetical protein [Pseudophaeobacter arcticus]|uniref:hypothetical protein n=1 Tax=Pseudophaeobacter arcticus TaxID=385492 RepID=UPI002492AEA2|nr:hypothetical protein [Pseudophaeobacter arcticus]
MNTFTQPRNLKGDARQYLQTFKGGILSPCHAVAFHENEGGLYDFRAVMELAPIAGRMYTKIRARFQTIFVPLQGIYALANPLDQYPGEDHIVRDMLQSGDPLFEMENDNEITQRCFVHPTPINGELKTCASTRLAYIAAVNHLRLRKYRKATLLENTHMTQSPALLSQTVLDRFNAVLDPDDRINGAVEFDIPNVKLPTKGLGVTSAFASTPYSVKEAGGVEVEYTKTHATNTGVVLSEDPDNLGHPDLYATGSLSTSQMSITDFYKAEQRDKRTRQMNAMLEADPVHGERAVLRWASGLKLDTTKTPFVIYEEEREFGYSLRSAMDGPNLDKEQTDSNLIVDFTVPIPRSEMGGVVITMVSVIPDETLEYQPHPIMSQPWTGTRYTEEEMEYDAVKVTNRQLAIDVPQPDENTTAFYTAHNRMKLRYSSYGLARNMDLTTVENKSALWQIKIPLSVDGDTILYPELEGQDNYPFADWNGDLCTAFISADVRIPTPMIVGPSPVETIDIIEDNDLFGQFPE